MAKRDIPEINAGSMADIAFLLLIFFLVTTTMDKDTAYVRQIPKKLDNPPETPPIEDRNICEIRANSQNALLFRNEELEDPNEISEKILEFYRMNEVLTESQTEARIQQSSYEGYNYPFYSFITLKGIEDAIEKEYKLAEEAEAVDNYDIADFHYKSVDDWKKKQKALQTLGINELKEIHPQAHIRVVVQQRTEYKLFAKIQSEIEEAIYELRDDAAKKYFGESYGVMKTRRAMDKADEQGDQPKLDVLKVLYPDRIIEVRPKK